MSAEGREESGSRKRSASARFIDQFLSQGPTGRLTGLLLGQLDAFNRISTTFGEEKSSEFCDAYAESLRSRLPSGTPIIRLSGRRFAVLLSLDSMSSVMDMAASITEDKQPQMQVGEDTFLVDVTLGVSVYPTHADDAASLFRRAELALKEARERELAFDIYRPEATEQQATLWKLESDLDKAVQRGELEVYYQPKVDIKGGVVSGVEALVRWRTESGRFVPPESFIPLAERSGSIVPLTWLVFDRVLKSAASWPVMDHALSVAINIAPQVLTHPHFHSRLRDASCSLRERNIDLVMELTEDNLLHDDGASPGALEGMKKLGVEIAIDDFGKGYSSLTYLKQIPASEIKIDRRFISTIAFDETDRQIVKAVIELAHALGMRVVAEGVDSEENLAAVADLGCEMAQGFFIARPMRSDLIPDWLSNYSASAVGSRMASRRSEPLPAQV